MPWRGPMPPEPSVYARWEAFGCVCPSPNAHSCMNIRYNIDPGSEDYDQEECECGCHDIWNEADDEEQSIDWPRGGMPR